MTEYYNSFFSEFGHLYLSVNQILHLLQIHTLQNYIIRGVTLNITVAFSESGHHYLSVNQILHLMQIHTLQNVV